MIIRYFFNTSSQCSFTSRLLTILKWNFRHSFVKNMNTKPPNILVYTGNTSAKLFEEICNNLQKCLQNDRYTIYHLLESEIKEQLWMENALLLIVSSDIVKNDFAKFFETYLKNFGNILLICSKFNNNFVGTKCFQMLDAEMFIRVNFKEVGNTILYRGKYSYNSFDTILCNDASGKPLIHKMDWNKNILICSEIYLDRDPAPSITPSDYKNDDRLSILKWVLSKQIGLEIKNDHSMPELTSGYYICKNEFESTKLLNQEKLANTLELPIFHECDLNYFDELIKLPIYFCKNSLHPSTFNIELYYSKLNSNVYGHHLIYFPVITSTMAVAEELSEYEGIVIVAGYQISGKGRRCNKWISPKGCAMFTVHFTVSLNSQLGKRMSLLQHISCLAVVHGIRSQTAYKDLELSIKWPNDIYHKETKLGGLIVTSKIQNDKVHVNVGWGVNVENSHPTTCLNDVIDKYNSTYSRSLPHLCVEEVVAFTLSQMECLMTDFINYGADNFFTLYYSYWMHNNQKVTLKNLNELGTVIGLDDYGFLKVKTNKGAVLTLQPDGNRFDIMKNLIYST